MTEKRALPQCYHVLYERNEIMSKLDGIYSAMVTPLNEDESINLDALQKLIDASIAKGVDGFYVSGSTGESYLLSLEERARLIEATVQAVAGRARVLAHVGMFSTRQTIELAQAAQKAGAAAVSAVPPFYFPFTKEEIIAFYHDLADAVDIPVLVYNIPDMSGVSFNMVDFERLLAHPNIACVKHTSFDLFILERLVATFPEKTFFIGHDEVFLSAWATGARAGIGTSINLMPEKFKRVVQLYDEGKMAEALTVQDEINRVVAALCEVGVWQGTKALLRMQGIDCGECRKPFRPLTPEQLAKLREVGIEVGIL